MDKGLAKFLNRIAADPSNKVLIGRFLALVADLPATRVQQEHLFALGSTLAEVEPGAALIHLESLRKSAPESIEVLELLKKCYVKTNRSLELASVQAKLDSLKPASEAIAVSSSKEIFPMSSERTAQLTQISISKNPQAFNISDSEQTKPRSPAPELLSAVGEQQYSKNLSFNEKTMVNMEVQKAVSEALIKGRSPGTERTNVQNEQAPAAEAKLKFVTKEPVVVAKVEENKTEVKIGITPARPIGLTPVASDSGQVFKLKEMFGLFWSLGEVAKAQEVLERLRPKLVGQDWFEARVEVCKAMQELPQAASSPLVIRSKSEGATSQAESKLLFKSKGPEWLSEIDDSIGEGRFRKALRNLADQLSINLSEGDCEAAWERAIYLFKKLNLLPFPWKSGMGAKKLKTFFESRPDRKYPQIVGDGI